MATRAYKSKTLIEWLMPKTGFEPPAEVLKEYERWLLERYSDRPVTRMALILKFGLDGTVVRHSGERVGELLSISQSKVDDLLQKVKRDLMGGSGMARLGNMMNASPCGRL